MRKLTHMAIGCKFFTMWCSPQGHLNVLNIWQLAFPTVSDPREQESKSVPKIEAAVFNELSQSEIPSLLLWVTKTNPCTMQKGEGNNNSEC